MVELFMASPIVQAMNTPIRLDPQVILNVYARALVDSPATCQLLIGMGFLEERR